MNPRVGVFAQLSLRGSKLLLRFFLRSQRRRNALADTWTERPVRYENVLVRKLKRPYKMADDPLGQPGRKFDVSTYYMRIAVV